MNTSENKIEQLLEGLGLIDRPSVEPFSPCTRDQADLPVLRCRRSGIIYLSRVQTSVQHYEVKAGFKFTAPELDRRQTVAVSFEDNRRRAETVRPWVCNKCWLDFGTGPGGILDLLGEVASEFAGCEPQEQARQALEGRGYCVYSDLEAVPDGHYDVITLFHVLEHLDEPVRQLEVLLQKLKPGGRIVVEVPHARDFLIDFIGLESFKQFTLWSEHLILHTRASLGCFLRQAGFTAVVVEGLQRYPLSNHLHWLARGKPGGHVHWRFLREPTLDTAYAAQLIRLDMSDTLFASAMRPN